MMTTTATTTTTTTATTTTEPGTERAAEQPAGRRWWPLSARARILGWYTVLLALAAVGELVLQRQVLLADLDRHVSGALAQEVDEVRALASGTNPSTGRPFGADAAAIFDVFLARNIPGEGEALLTFVDGRPYKATRNAAALLDDAQLMQQWSQVTTSQWGEVETDLGPTRYLAVPLQAQGRAMGVFVVANLLNQERQEVEHAVRVGATIWLSLVGLASLAAWWVAGRVLAPVRLVSDTARELTESDLSRRVPVEGNDEIAQLAHTFNAMLQRLEEAFESQRAFLDDASHELRTPITVIRGHLELMGDDPEEQRQTVALVTDELDRMGRLVDELLLLARAEQPDFLQLEQVDLDLLTNEVLRKAQALGNWQLTLEGSGYGVIVADRQRLTQALMNLIDNACRHTDRGEPIGLGSAMLDDEARIWVRDGGPGIPPHEQERIFQRFMWEAGGRRRPGRAGLGLAITRTIAEAHGGRVEVESRPGEGSTFTLVLPTADGQRAGG
ncbi:MAG: sensor histidine kinase [Acidimicrobiia bacterium]